MNREIGKYLYGSQNYGLDNENSDKDYCHIVYPTFGMLYSGTMADEKVDEHNKIMDVRTFYKYFLRGNINQIELLYSVDKEENQSFSEKLKPYVRSIVVDNAMNFFNSARGFATSSYTRNKGSNKGAARAMWMLNFLNSCLYFNFIIDGELFRDESIVSSARLIRYEDAPFDYDEWNRKMDELKEKYKKIKAATSDKFNIRELEINILQDFNHYVNQLTS